VSGVGSSTQFASWLIHLLMHSKAAS